MYVYQNKKTRALILVMVALVFLGLTIAHFYYKKINSSIDPRVVHARKLYEQYNYYTQINSLDSVIYLMDSIEIMYASIPHYRNSFETGVLYNNRAAALLTMALFSTEIDSVTKDSLFQLSEKETLISIYIYKNWLKTYKDLSEEEIEKHIIDEFLVGIQIDNKRKIDNYLNNRIEEILDAQQETPRRLSVSYTNLGIVYRHKEKYEDAANMYIKALELWEDNLTAENNLNVLLGRPLKKRTFLQKLFPPAKK